MKKTRWGYDRNFKILILDELDAGKLLAREPANMAFHPSLPCRWKTELAENSEKAFKGNGNLILSNHGLQLGPAVPGPHRF